MESEIISDLVGGAEGDMGGLGTNPFGLRLQPFGLTEVHITAQQVWVKMFTTLTTMTII